MFGTKHLPSTIAIVLGTSLAFAATASAGGYAGNGCVAKKQGALAKYTKDVGKAWAKNPSDTVARDEAILKAFAKLDKKWTKEEEKAVKKNATCHESTSTAVEATDAVNAAVTAISGEDFEAATGYIGDAIKSYGKYTKDPLKDPGKVKLAENLAKADTKHLTGANGTITAAAAALQSELLFLTTQAPNYAQTFQTIVPGSPVQYGKKELEPVCVDGDPYMFFAKRGNSNNVLMYYQGGGACWSTSSCITLGTCDRISNASDNPDNTTTGFADYNNPSNPFYDWNVVFVSYCSCDVHWGDNALVYGTDVIRHHGRDNAAVAEKWAREHFIDPDKVFVTGSSAGSYGAIMNSYFLMNEVWPNADYSILGDAGVGIITKQWLDEYIKNWGLEENFPTELPGVALPVESLSLVDLIAGLNEQFPDARIGNYDSSYDGGGGSQTQFFQVMRFPTPPNDNILNRWGNYWEPACTWNACMREFKADNASRSSKYHYFTGAGSRHTIFGSDKIFTETKSRKADGTPVTFVEWVQAMIDDSPDWVDVDCNNTGGDCNLTNSCQGGDNPGMLCTNDADCAVGGVCQKDPDNANAPYANDGTVTCPLTTCPCGPLEATCAGGVNEGDPCSTNGDCRVVPGDNNEEGTCSYVNCAEAP